MDRTPRGTFKAPSATADYDDSINVRHATVIPFILNHFGGVNPTGTKLLHRVKARTKGTGAIDRTEYIQGGPTAWLPHWVERIAVATATRRRARRRR